jgi:hypothetical protein
MENKDLVKAFFGSAADTFQPIVDEFRPIVAEIEQSQHTTKNHYGQYMGLLSNCAAYNIKPKTLCLLLICAGANKDGVIDAARIVGIN